MRENFRDTERFEHETRVCLELDGQRGFVGTTANVSRNGAFFTLGYAPFQVQLQEFGFLHLMPLDEGRTAPCKVARLTGDGIAIQILDQPQAGMVSRMRANLSAATHEASLFF